MTKRICTLCKKPRWARTRQRIPVTDMCKPCRWKAGDRPKRIERPHRIKHRAIVQQPTGDKSKKKKGKK